MNVIPKLAQLSSRVWRVLGCNPGPMTLQGTNIYLIGTGSKRILLDAGQDGFPEYINNLKGLLREQNISVERILITHWHHDHIGALGDLKETVFSNQKQSLPPVHKFVRKELPERDLPEGYVLNRMEDNEEYKVEGATLRVLFTPGHTSDHAAVYLQEENAVFSGDCILGEGTAVFEDLHDYMKSLERIRLEKPNVIYPGHGPVVDEPSEKIKYYLHHRRERESQILGVINSSKQPVTPREIVKAVYKETPSNLLAAAEINVVHHLTKLVKEKKVRQNEETYFPADSGKF